MYFSARIREAATWAIAADLMRRHEATEGLRVIETHPCDGQYDCRCIIQPRGSDYGMRLDLNLGSGNAHVSAPIGRPREPEAYPWAGRDGPLPYVAALLQADHRMQVVDYLEARLGLPSLKKSPTTTRHALTYRVMAEIAARVIFDGPEVRWENGAIDTSGWPPSDPIRPELRAVPEVARLLATTVKPGLKADHPAYRYWIWMTRDHLDAPFTALAVVDAEHARLWRLSRPGEALDLMEPYDATGRQLRKTVNELD